MHEKYFSKDVLMLLFIQAGLLSKKICLHKVSHIIKNYFSQNIDLIINAGVRNLYLTQSIRLLSNKVSVRTITMSNR